MSSDDHLLMFSHVPQHSRKAKLRFPLDNNSLHLLQNSMIPEPPPSSTYLPLPQAQGQQFSLSLSSAPCPSSSPLLKQQNLSNRLTPLGPFTGYAAVLSRSRFVEPARKLLDEVCDAGGRHRSDDSSVDVGFDGDDITDALRFGEIFNSELQWRRTRLISLHDEVQKRYKQYYQQVQAVISSFESVAGLSTAAPYASTVLKTMTKHFRWLKNIIISQLRHTNKVLGKDGSNKEEISSLGFLDGNCIQRVASSSTTFAQSHVWRPQRGLPERAVAVLRAWLFEHFLHPYPTDTDKQMLAKQTGLTRNQVSNWFINARVRLWKPMVEEIHSLDMRQKSKTIASGHEQNNGQQAQLLTSSNAALCNFQQPENAASNKDNGMMQNNVRKELSQASNGIQDPLNYEYVGFPSHHHPVGNDQSFGTGGNTGVSLTLGLQQNNGICFPEQLSLNVVRRFGLEDCNDAYLMSSFVGQDRQFGKDVGSRLLHDFVG